MWTVFQCLKAIRADAQTTKNTAMSDLAVELLTGHTGQRIPHVIGNGHGAVFLVAGIVQLV